MKTRNRLRLAAVVVLAASASGAWAAETRATLTAKLHSAGAYVVKAQDGNPHFIRTPPGGAIPLTTTPTDDSPEAVARAAMKDYGTFFGITNPRTQLVTKRVTTRDGRSATRFQQMHSGLPVIGGELIVNNRGNTVTSINGRTARGLKLDTSVKVDANTAVAAAQATVAKVHGVSKAGLRAGKPTLSVYVPSLIGPGGDHASLVWRTEVTLAGHPIRELVLVDAVRGGVALHFNQVDTARNRVTYSAGGTANNDTTTLSAICTESTPCPAGNADAVAAHQYAADTYNFWSTHHGRDGIDGAGMEIVSVVDIVDGSICPNAWWDGEQMNYCEEMSLADDVVAHEMSHGMTENTSGLFYYYQSGAINESFSDLWGELIDLTNNRGNDGGASRWAMGEDLPAALFGGPIRSMKDPTLFSDPDRMTSANYNTSTDDNGGVHTNSGVNNKAVYLMVDGGVFNGRTVSGIGITKTAAIYYEAQTNLLTSGSDYFDLYQALQQGCSNLIGGDEGISTADCGQVRIAAEAVEMNLEPVAGFNPDVGTCPAHTSMGSVVFADDMESNVSGHWILSGTSDIWQYITGYAASGSQSLYGRDIEAASDSSIGLTTAVVMPGGAYLSFEHAFGLEGGWDGGVIEYTIDGGTSWVDANSLGMSGQGYNDNLQNNGNPLGTRSAFSGDSHGYVTTRINLAALTGETVAFRWRIGSDNSVEGPLGWLVDDVSIHTCTGGAVNAAPVAVADSYAVQVNTGLSVGSSGVLYNDSDADGDALTAALNAGPTHAESFTLNADGTFDYVPVTDFGGIDTFTYTASDGTTTATATVTIAVESVILGPADLTATAVNTSQINLSWSDTSPNETGFSIFQSKDGGAAIEVGTVGANVTTFSDTGLTPGTEYTYYVVATNTLFTSAQSNVATATTYDLPAAPTGLTATTAGKSRINLAWVDTSNEESGVRVYRSRAGGSYEVVADLDADTTAFSDTGLAAGTRYNYYVTAYRDTESPASNVATATTSGGGGGKDDGGGGGGGGALGWLSLLLAGTLAARRKLSL